MIIKKIFKGIQYKRTMDAVLLVRSESEVGSAAALHLQIAQVGANLLATSVVVLWGTWVDGCGL